ncbi:MAG: transposase [Thermoplasmatales archaeon]
MVLPIEREELQEVRQALEAREICYLPSLRRKVVDWNNNAVEKALRSSVVIRKMTYGNQSDEGARAHAVLMSIKETCNLRKENFYDYAMQYLSPTSKR